MLFGPVSLSPLLWQSTPNYTILLRSKTLYYDVQPFLYYIMVRKKYNIKGVVILALNTAPTDCQ